MSDRNLFGTAGSKDFTDDLQRWHAVETRDKAADGAFFYAVTTTGIYCRPSCSSRRRNVRMSGSITAPLKRRRTAIGLAANVLALI